MNEKPKLKRTSENLMDFRITPPRLKSKRRTKSLLLVLKPLACVLGPLTVPTIMYVIIGCTTFFWWMLGIALLSSLLLLILDIQKVKDLIDYLKINHGVGIGCLIKVGLMILVCGVTTYAYHIHFYEIFCVCLFIAGVITGTLITDITTWWNFRRKKNLPYVNFTKNSPKPVPPVFLDLRRKSFNVPSRATNFLPLKRNLSSPTKQSSKILNYPTLEEVKFHDLTMSTGTPTDIETSATPAYPSISSSSGESDLADVPQQPMNTTPTKRRVISAVNISLSPLIKIAEIPPNSKRRLEFSAENNPLQPLDISQLQTPTSVYSNCNVEGLLSQNFNFFHM